MAHPDGRAMGRAGVMLMGCDGVAGPWRSNAALAMSEYRCFLFGLGVSMETWAMYGIGVLL